jgi:orotidine-5'-phosphate decarboxylase
MNEQFADRLLEAIEAKGSAVCVGLDPVYERLPPELHVDSDEPEARVEAIRAFCRRVLEIVAPIVPAVKPQIAYFEAYRHFGVELYYDMVRAARSMGLIVIGDAKRGDIGSTAQAYASAHLGSDDCPDALTVNGYFGADGLAPFVEQAKKLGRGIFVLVRTSNPSAASIQDFADADGRTFYEHIAGRVAELGAGEGLVGARGFSSVGAVVGATWPEEARKLREIMPNQIFLVPGYGAQGASAADCAAAFNAEGHGAIVNASRSVLYAFSKEDADRDWQRAIEKAAGAFAADIAGALK